MDPGISGGLDPPTGRDGGDGSGADDPVELPNPPFRSLLTSLPSPDDPPEPESGTLFAARAVSDSSQDTASLLRRRLRVACVVGAIGFLLDVVRVLIAERLNTTTFDDHDVLIYLLRSGLAATLLAANAVALSRRRQLTLPTLRRLELLAVATVVGLGLWGTAEMFAAFLPTFAADDGLRNILGVYLATGAAVYWMAVIAAYGTFIPNTLRRSLCIVVPMAVAPVLVGAIVAGRHPIDAGTRLQFLSTLLLWMAIAAALSIYGARRVEVLRRQMRQARQLGPYRLGRLLGAGGMGEVYFAEHLLLRRPCAVKLIHPERTDDAAMLARFEREAQATARLTNWHTVAVFDYGRSQDGTFYYVMEYLPGWNLQQLVERRGPLPPERVVHFLLQMCEALQEAHANGLIHRDVKPSNIIIGERGGHSDVATLVDFGLVREWQPWYSADPTIPPLTKGGPGGVAIAGTPAFMSPEQAEGRVELDHRSDIYSLGCVGYFLLTGRPPFERENLAELLAARIHEIPEKPTKLHPGVPADLEAVIMYCLRRNPDDRIPTVAELSRRLKACPCSGGWTASRAQTWWSEHGETVVSA